MGLIDSIIGVESGGNPNATNPRSSASGLIGSNPASLSTVDIGCELSAGALVGELLLSRSPLAIFGRVIAVVISTIQGMLFARARPHVFKEILERLPSFADLNATSAVVLVRSVFRQIAASAHAIPDLILGRSLAASLNGNRHAVSSGASSVASAATGISGSKVSNRYNSFNSAVANAKHASDSRAAILSDLWCCFRDSFEFSELKSNAVYRGCH